MHIHKVVPASNCTYNHHNPSKHRVSRNLAISIHMLLGWKSAFFLVKRTLGCVLSSSCGNQLNQHEIVDLPINSMVVFHSDMLVCQRVNLHFPVFLWFSYGFPMVFLWFSYGFSHGFPMVFPWFSYANVVLWLRFSRRSRVGQTVDPGRVPDQSHWSDEGERAEGCHR